MENKTTIYLKMNKLSIYAIFFISLHIVRYLKFDL